MSIRNIKKAMKNSSGFLTLGIHNHGYYAINEDDKLVFHKKGIDVVHINFSVFIEYVLITRIILDK